MISAIKIFHRSVEWEMRKVDKGRKKAQIFKYASTEIYHNVQTSRIFLSFLNIWSIFDAWDKINQHRLINSGSKRNNLFIFSTISFFLVNEIRVSL